LKLSKIQKNHIFAFKYHDTIIIDIFVPTLALNDPYPRFQGHVIIRRWISQKPYEIQTSMEY